MSFGDHTAKFAYYVSAGGNYSEWGLEPPTRSTCTIRPRVAADLRFPSLQSASQRPVRFNAGLRLDYYQVPNDPDMQAAGD